MYKGIEEYCLCLIIAFNLLNSNKNVDFYYTDPQFESELIIFCLLATLKL